MSNKPTRVDKLVKRHVAKFFGKCEDENVEIDSYARSLFIKELHWLAEDIEDHLGKYLGETQTLCDRPAVTLTHHSWIGKDRV